MAVSPYRVTPARIGNSSGLRLPAAFYRDHPQFAGAAGQVEVLDDRTLLLRLEPEEQQQGEAEEDSLMLGLFLDFLSRQALTADQGPVLYTEAMAADDDELLAGVTVDAAGDPLLDPLHHCRQQLHLGVLNEGLGVELLLEPFHLGLELGVLPREEVGLEGDRPAMAHQRRTHAPSGSPAASTVTPASSSSSSAAMASV